jgi:peroxiredoxin
MKIYSLVAAILFFSLQSFGQTGLKKGMKAPEFTAKDNDGKTIDMKELLRSHKAVVVFFYRGQWCPYCNRYIKQLQDSLQLLTDKGAYVIGVTPETSDNINQTVSKTHASFSIIQDKGYKIMKAYDVNYTVDDATMSKMNKYGVDLEKNNGNKDHVLPVPATYIVDRSGTITYVYFNKDITHRAPISTLLEQM